MQLGSDIAGKNLDPNRAPQLDPINHRRQANDKTLHHSGGASKLKLRPVTSEAYYKFVCQNIQSHLVHSERLTPHRFKNSHLASHSTSIFFAKRYSPTMGPIKHKALINVDLGEGYGNWSITSDEDLLPFIDHANIACGFHASYVQPHLSYRFPICDRTMVTKNSHTIDPTSRQYSLTHRSSLGTLS